MSNEHARTKEADVLQRSNQSPYLHSTVSLFYCLKMTVYQNMILQNLEQICLRVSRLYTRHCGRSRMPEFRIESECFYAVYTKRYKTGRTFLDWPIGNYYSQVWLSILTWC